MKKKLLSKIKTKSFWVQLAGAVILLLRLCGLKIDAPYAAEITEAVCSLLIIFGLIAAPAPASAEPVNKAGQADDAPTPERSEIPGSVRSVQPQAAKDPDERG